MQLDQAVRTLVSLAQKTPNVEVCGVILDNFEVVPIRNVATDSNAFLFDKFEWFALLRDLKKIGNEILCVWHSHPSGDLTPSDTDMFSQQNVYKKDFIIVNRFHQYKVVKYVS